MLLTKEKTKECIDRIIKGCPQSLILKELRLTDNRNSIRLSAKKHNLDFPRTRNTYVINGSYFDIIENDNQCYILGLLYADGSITQGGHSNEKLSLVLNDKDKPTVEWVLTDLKPKGKLYYIKKKNQVGFNITLPYLTSRLKTLGIVPNKSFDNNFLIPKYIFTNKDLFLPFLRGFFDGDGSIFKTTSTYYQRYNLNFSSTNVKLIKKIKYFIELYFYETFNFKLEGTIRKDIWSPMRKTDLFQYTISNPLLIMWLGNSFYTNNPAHFMSRKCLRFIHFAEGLTNTNSNIQNYCLVKKEAETLINNAKI